MKYSNRLCWFYGVWWEEQNQFIDCLVDISILDVLELNDGFWLVRTQDGFVLKQVAKLDSELILGKAKGWSVNLR